MADITKKDVKDIIDRELKSGKTKSVVKDIINSEIESKKFKDSVKKITKDVLESFYKTLWVKREFWKSTLK